MGSKATSVDEPSVPSRYILRASPGEGERFPGRRHFNPLA
jgi:hypothetical protein